VKAESVTQECKENPTFHILQMPSAQSSEQLIRVQIELKTNWYSQQKSIR
jgi:hypothetical protein